MSKTDVTSGSLEWLAFCVWGMMDQSAKRRGGLDSLDEQDYTAPAFSRSSWGEATMRTIVLLTLALGITGCLTVSRTRVPDTQRMKLLVDEKEMKSEVLRHVPIGVSIEEARETMEKSGFKCHFGRENTAPFAPGEEMGAFCLVCSQFTPRKSWFEALIKSDEIRVFLLFEQGKVNDVRVRHIRTCM